MCSGYLIFFLVWGEDPHSRLPGSEICSEAVLGRFSVLGQEASLWHSFPTLGRHVSA